MPNRASALPRRRAAKQPDVVLEIQRAFEVILGLVEDTRVHERVGATLGVPITRSGAFTLSALRDAGPLRISDLAAAFDLDLSTVSRHVRSLERMGLVEREPHPEDGRAVLVRASDKGEDLGQRMHDIWSGFLERAMADWTQTERAAMSEMLSRLAAGLVEIVPRAAPARS